MFNYYEMKGISAREYPNGHISIERRDAEGGHVIDITPSQDVAVRAFVNAVRNQRQEVQ